jgi:alanine racemase
LTRPTVAEINLSAIKRNLKKLKSLSEDSLFYPVVKANAYGLGFKPVVKEIESLIDGFSVATSEEALEVRKISKKNILCMEGPYDQKEFNLLLKNKIDLVIHSERQINFVKKIKTFPKEIKVWIKLDTGMNRLGFKEEEVLDIFKIFQTKTKKIVLMSHFSSAAGSISSKTNSKKQIEKFNRIEKKLKKYRENFFSSLCNSGGLLNYKSSHKDIVRPGISLYGVDQKDIGKKIGLENVITFKTKLISIKDVNKGDKVGYDGKWKAKKDSKIGILPVGYADGYPVTTENKGYVLIDGKKANVIGKVSMDLTAVDITNLKDTSYESEIILWGKDLPVEKVAKITKNIPYTILTSLSSRVKRIYL